MKNFRDWYSNLQEQVAAISPAAPVAGEDHSSKEAISKVADSKKKHLADFEAKGAGKVIPPEAGKDYTKS